MDKKPAMSHEQTQDTEKQTETITPGSFNFGRKVVVRELPTDSKKGVTLEELREIFRKKLKSTGG